jgi:hypothetical protein
MSMSEKDPRQEPRNTVKGVQKQYQNQLNRLTFKTEAELELLDSIREYMMVII